MPERRLFRTGENVIKNTWFLRRKWLFTGEKNVSVKFTELASFYSNAYGGKSKKKKKKLTFTPTDAVRVENPSSWPARPRPVHSTGGCRKNVITESSDYFRSRTRTKSTKKRRDDYYYRIFSGGDSARRGDGKRFREIRAEPGTISSVPWTRFRFPPVFAPRTTIAFSRRGSPSPLSHPPTTPAPNPWCFFFLFVYLFIIIITVFFKHYFSSGKQRISGLRSSRDAGTQFLAARVVPAENVIVRFPCHWADFIVLGATSV